MTDNLKRLRELTERLPVLGPSLVGEKADGMVNYRVEEGVCLGYALMNNACVAVQRVTLTPGTTFPTHTHNEKEFVIIYSGKAVHMLPDREEELEVGDFIVSHPHEPHAFRAITYCEVIAITVPSSDGYPSR